MRSVLLLLLFTLGTESVLAQSNSYQQYRKSNLEKGLPIISEDKFIRIHFLDSLIFSEGSKIDTIKSWAKTGDFIRYYSKGVSTSEKYNQAMDTVLLGSSADARSYNFYLDYFFTVFSSYGPQETFTYLVKNYIDPETCSDLPNNEQIYQRLQSFKSVSVGAKFEVDIRLMNLENQWIEVDSVIGKNKLTVLLFWSPACPHCTMELPKLKPIYEQYKDLGLAFVGIALYSEIRAIQYFLESQSIEWINLVEPLEWKSPYLKQLFISGTPHFILIDKKGIIIDRPKSLDAIEKNIQSELGKR